MSATATAANFAWWMSNRPAHSAFRRAIEDPRREQERILLGYLRRHEATDFGREHGFSRIGSIDAFRERVPISDYDALAPWIDRIAAGEANVLTADPVIRLATTSGSTRARKLIPYTRSLQREFNRAIGPWIVDLYRSEPSLARGCAYWSISPVASEPQSHEPGKPPIGFEEDSAYLGGVRKRLVDAVMAVPAEVRHIGEIEAFRYVTLRLLLGRADLRLISVWHPSFLELLLDAASVHWDRLIADIAAGTITPPAPIPPHIQSCLLRHARADRTRADHLRAIGAENWREIWPALKLISCWADAHAAGPASALAGRLPGVRVQAKGLLATEALVTIPFANAHPLAIRSHFFEFLDDAGVTRLADELERGEEYAVVVTTTGGLWRYRLGDRVEVDGYIGATPSLRFVGRDDHVVDRFGEKLSEGFVGQAIRAMLDRLGIAADFALLAPQRGDTGTAYTLFIQSPSPLGVHLADCLDASLFANEHYAYCRRLGQLLPARAFHVRRDAFETYSKALRRLGVRLGDIKATPLSDRSDWAEVFDGGYVGAVETEVSRPH
jgi:hypothetical protein